MDPDLADFLTAWLGGEIAEARRQAVLSRLQDDPEFRLAAARELRLFGMLKVLRTASPRWLRLEDELGWSADEPPGSDDFVDSVSARVASLPVPRSPRRPTYWRRAGALVALAVVAVAALRVVWLRAPTAPAPLSNEAIALLVRLNGPGWSGGGGPAEGSVVHPGKLALLGGSATLAFFNGVTVHLEGPTDVDLQSANRVFCRRGKVRVDAPAEVGAFATDAPGAAVTNAAAEFALTVSDDDHVEVMVFRGQAEVAALDQRRQPVRSETLTAGQAVRVDATSGQIAAAARTPETFAGPIPPFDPALVLAPGYAEAVLTDRPAGYWRFETAATGLVPNEVPTGPPLRLIGQADISKAAGGMANRHLNLPPPTEWEQNGALADHLWSPPGRSFAVECWAMPRLVRQAAVVGLITDTGSHRLDNYGILLELTGQPSLFHQPVRSVRALHRLPAGRFRGDNLFTPSHYLPYRWLHVVAQRSGDRFELYVNGELAAVCPPASDLPLPHFWVGIGALCFTRDGKSCSERPFVGQVDEVAVYDHALALEAIQRHHRLGRPGGARE